MYLSLSFTFFLSFCFQIQPPHCIIVYKITTRQLFYHRFRLLSAVFLDVISIFLFILRCITVTMRLFFMINQKIIFHLLSIDSAIDEYSAYNYVCQAVRSGRPGPVLDHVLGSYYVKKFRTVSFLNFIFYFTMVQSFYK